MTAVNGRPLAVDVFRLGELIVTVAQTGQANYDILIEANSEEPEITVKVSSSAGGDETAFSL